MIAKYVDFHCHLDLYPDPEVAIAEADAAGVYTLTVTTTPRAWPRNLALTRRTKHVRAALGFHPQLVAEHRDELATWEKYLPETRYVGEIGLDAQPRFCPSLELQKRVLARILTCCAEAGNKILTVHSIRSAKAVLDLIETHLPPDRGKVVLHWFTGSKAETARAVELGCFFSVNARMLGNHRGRELVVDLPGLRLLTETDGPFTEVSGRPSRPADVAATVQQLAKLRRASVKETAIEIQQTLQQLLASVPPETERSQLGSQPP
ncbi:MAG: TatD family hydrolase [Bryobacteraceae bacterium]|nr:TatD family hydrolase [Bryobacteraceae bacterium]